MIAPFRMFCLLPQLMRNETPGSGERRRQIKSISHSPYLRDPAMSITLTYRGESSIPVEIEGLTPDWAWDKPLVDIERFKIFHGNRKVPLAEMFSVAGDAGDKRFRFEGNLTGVHWIGAHMRTGQIYVHGPAGRHVGSELRGGEIHVEADAGGWVGCEMRGGLIHVHGNADHFVGAAYRGSAQGMRGGTIIVDGNAGNEIGHSMRNGVIAIGGQAGNMIGFNMTGGTVLVLGDAGIRAGAGMHGGTIALFGPTRPSLLPSFRFDRTGKPDELVTNLREFLGKAAQPFAKVLSDELEVYVGDQIAEGTGEIYMRPPTTV
jgi:formylmethanofuran dehydrogenase subunit C